MTRTAGDDVLTTDLPVLTEDELPANAWLVYSAIVESSLENHALVSYVNKVQGTVQSISIYHVCAGLWPKLAVLGRGSGTVRNTHRLIVRYLIETGNLVLVERGNKTRKSVWWVPDEWQDHGKERTATEDAVSASVDEPETEAETEEKAPTESTVTCPLCGQVCATEAGMVKHALATHIDLDNELVTYMRKHKGEHVHISMIREDMREKTGLPLSNLCVSVHLRHLDAEPLTGVKRTDTMGYYQHETVHTCREPGCGERFAYRQQLLDHEDVEHEHSKHRQFGCDDCDMRFYNARGLQTHTRQAHGDRSVTVDKKEADVPTTTQPPKAVPTDLEALAHLIQSAQADKAELARVREGLKRVAGIITELSYELNALINQPEA